MTGARLSMKWSLLPMVLVSLLQTGCAVSDRVSSEPEACERVKASFADPAARARITACDHVMPDTNPPGFYVMSVQSDRQCDGICSRNMGWFAVRRSTGEVFEWDVAEMTLGRRV